MFSSKIQLNEQKKKKEFGFSSMNSSFTSNSEPNYSITLSKGEFLSEKVLQLPSKNECKAKITDTKKK